MRILKDNLRYHYSYLQSIPHELTDYLNQKSSITFSNFQTVHDFHNSNIISGDESWFFYIHHMEGNHRKVYKCAVNHIVECDFLTYCKTPAELLRFINHSIISHKDDFINQIIRWINSRSISNFNDLS